MQDQDAPPVEEGETGGDVVVVRAAQTQVAVAVVVDGQDATSNMAAFIAPLWTIAIVPTWAREGITAPGQDGKGQGSAPTTPSLTPILCQFAKTRPREYSASSMTSSFRRRSRKRRASSTLKSSS